MNRLAALAVSVRSAAALAEPEDGDFKVQQGLWGTRYTVKVDGAECRLTK